MNEPRILIVGGGPAGVRAAETLVAHGCRPVLVDEADKVGGQIYRQRPDAITSRPRTLYGFEAAKAVSLHATFTRIREQVDYRPRTLAWNLQDSVAYLCSEGRLSSLAFDALILATGATDRIFPIRGWTLPGVYSLGAAQIALKYQACAIGRRTVLFGSTPLLYLVAYQYLRAGAEVAAVVDTGTLMSKISGLAGMLKAPSMLAQGMYYLAALRVRGVPVHFGAIAAEVAGDRFVSGFRAAFAAGQRLDIECDAVGMGFHLRSEVQLADLAGCSFAYDATARQWAPVADEDGRAGNGIYVAGDGARIAGADAAETAGRLAALAILADRRVIDADDARLSPLRRLRRRQVAFQRGIMRAFPFPVHLVEAAPDDLVLCRCEAVTVGDFRASRDMSLEVEDVNRRKALCRIGMGRCQGRYCGLAAMDLLAAQCGISPERAGRLRAQAPVKPVPLSATVDTTPDAA